MAPKPADPAVRKALIEAAARIVATEGRASLTLRRLAGEVGTSTMAIYTHFGSMDELRREVRLEGFARLRATLGAVNETRDPMADLTLLGAAYYLSATSEPNLYRAMFLDGPVDEGDLATGLDTFMYLVNAVARCIEAGRLPKASTADPAELALEVWALTHGLVSLQLAHLLPPEQAVEHLRSGARSLFVAWGANPGQLKRSGDRATARSAELSTTGVTHT
ncbi:MAG TPA: TetR/AcrR family transcriptional regulator [Acidimicrobiales bacterium]|nr:TetR/AcrR family transcriptional regulator [Acidimicrobiales bacterium]